jgi:hypothetical protein
MEEAMDFSLELGTDVLRRAPEVVRVMLSDLSDNWTTRDEGPGT